MREAPAGVTAKASGNVAVGTDDTFQIAVAPLEIQIHRLRNRYGWSASMARAVAGLAFATPETWRSAR